MSTSAKEKLDVANAHIHTEALAFFRVKKALENASIKLLAIRDEVSIEKRVKQYQQIEQEIENAVTNDIEDFNYKMNVRDEMERLYKKALDEEAAASPKQKKAKVCDEK
jgi:hypothetical protein